MSNLYILIMNIFLKIYIFVIAANERSSEARNQTERSNLCDEKSSGGKSSDIFWRILQWDLNLNKWIKYIRSTGGHCLQANSIAYSL